MRERMIMAPTARSALGLDRSCALRPPGGCRLPGRATESSGGRTRSGHATDRTFPQARELTASVPSRSRFQRIVRRHPPSERQKFPTSVFASSSLIFAAERYIPVCRSSVSRNGVVTKPPVSHAKKAASRAGIKKIERDAQRASIRQHESPSVPQIRSCLERSIVSGIVESRELGRVVGLHVWDKIISRCILAMSQGKAAIIPGFDGNLSDAPQTRGQPLSERDLLRRAAHFKAREMR